jgi:Ca2+-binding EF-hand superfamily protein
MFDLVDLEGKEKLTISELLRLSDNLGFNLTFDEIQTIVKNIAGPKERELTWTQFNQHIAKKVEKKTVY